MGMFDFVRNSYPLGHKFTGQCQTKDIDRCDGGTMSQYWISPVGHLYLIDYSYTANFVEFKENNKNKFLNFNWVPNGSHGKVRPWLITNYVTIYPEKYDNEWPQAKLHFIDGKLQDFSITIKTLR